MTTYEEHRADPNFVPFVIRPDVRDCTICGVDLDLEVAGLWPNVQLRTCSAWRCNKIASTFMSLSQDVALAQTQGADQAKQRDLWKSEFERRGKLLDQQMVWRRRMLRRRFALKVLFLGSRAFGPKVWR